MHLRARRAACLGLLALWAAACGGGGGGGGPPPDPPPDGIAGKVFFPDVHLGRISETEPNDSLAQPYLLPPVSARTTLEVRGEAGTTDEWFGTTDPVDVLRFETMVAQDVTLTVTFPLIDPVALGTNAMKVEVFDATGAPVTESAGGFLAQVVSFSTAAATPMDVVITCTAGHVAWLASFESADPVTKPAGETTPPPDIAATGGSPPAPPPVECAPDHVIVRLRPGADPAAVAERLGLVADGPTGSGSWRMRYPDAAAPAGAARKAGDVTKAATADPDVQFAEPDWMVQPLGLPNDRHVARQWHLRAIDAPGAWQVTQGSPSVVVAVIDTGITPHPDLAGQVLPGWDFISDPNVSFDGDGRDPDPTDRGDQGESSGLSTWHGTYVSALVAGRCDDGEGVCGVAPGVKILPLRVLGVGGGLVSDVSAAIKYAAGLVEGPNGQFISKRVEVINLSLGIILQSIELGDACQQAADAGVLLVAAAGNTGGALQFPGGFPSVMSVGAVDATFSRVSYSSFGPELDIVAPGGDSGTDRQGDGWPDGVLSALVDQTVEPRVFAHEYRDGTSGASPQVAATAALLFSIDPSLTAAQVRGYLESTALDLGAPDRDDVFGHGMVQTHEAVRRLLVDLGTPQIAPTRVNTLMPCVRFQGQESTRFVPITNGGGGALSVTQVLGTTDDAGGWLSATLVPAPPGGPSDVLGVNVDVDRAVVAGVPGRYSGTVRFLNGSTVVATLPVLMYIGVRQHAGSDLAVVAEERTTGIVPRRGEAQAATGYRFWLRGISPSVYDVRSGEDLDDDGQFCEPGDACGWHGGPTEADSDPVLTKFGQPTVGVDVTLFPTGP